MTASGSATPTATPSASATSLIRVETACVFVVYPNPYDPRTAYRGTLKFHCLPAGADIRIFTTSLYLVWHGRDVAQGTAEWDGRTLSGSRAAPGVYFYVVEPGGARPNIRGTFTVIE